MQPFIHLHLHSSYSLAEGAIHIKKLKELCLQHEMPAVAVTDTNNLFGALEASEVLSDAGIQSISGLQIALDPEELDLHLERYEPLPSLVLLAQNERQNFAIFWQDWQYFPFFFFQNPKSFHPSFLC